MEKRQEMLQKILGKIDANIPSMVQECQYVTVNKFTQDGRRIYLLTNYSTDDFENVTVTIGEDVNHVYEISRENGEIISVEFKLEDGKIMLSGMLEHMKSRCFILQ